MQVYKRIAYLVNAMENCHEVENYEMELKHGEKIDKIVILNMPRGSGFDNGTKFDLSESNSDKLVFTSAYHKMDENGYYDGWLHFKVIVTPSLRFDIDMQIEYEEELTDDEKCLFADYIEETFYEALLKEVER